MKQKIVYIGLDVDDTQYHGSAFNKETGEILSFRCRPTLKGLLGQLVKVRKHFPRHVIKLAYEASYIGSTLQRDLADKKYHCDVVAPSSIPRQGGKAIKTDRIDAAQLTQFYANGSSYLSRRRNRFISCTWESSHATNDPQILLRRPKKLGRNNTQ